MWSLTSFKTSCTLYSYERRNIESSPTKKTHNKVKTKSCYIFCFFMITFDIIIWSWCACDDVLSCASLVLSCFATHFFSLQNHSSQKRSQIIIIIQKAERRWKQLNFCFATIVSNSNFKISFPLHYGLETVKTRRRLQ